jgi:hypothetical protein
MSDGKFVTLEMEIFFKGVQDEECVAFVQKLSIIIK